ncbi:MAG: MarR family winged helix-turn-helix transcriptional regulator [Parvibaculaceae bacterium]
MPLPKQIAFLVNDVARLLRRKFDQRAQTLGLTRAQWQVLAYVGRNEGTNQASLADFMEIEPITLSRHLDRMQASGLVERRQDPSDRRAYQLFLTEPGKELLGKIRALGAVVLEEVLTGIPQGDVEKLVETLLAMRGNLSTRTEDGANDERLAS